MHKPLIILPVENQVRELDAKLLLACVAAQQGYRCVLGWRGKIDARIGRFPPSIYLAKSMSRQNTKMFRINRKLGHATIAWDEEAVVHYPQEIYYQRRIGPEALGLVDTFIAWGRDNDRLLRNHPNFGRGDIRIVGNPRADLLRRDMSAYFEPDAHLLRERYGDFILVNTNFGSVNAYSDSLNLVQSSSDGAGEPALGRGAIGMPVDYARGLFAYRSRVLECFQSLVPKIAAAFPNKTVVLRPHPSENHALWQTTLGAIENVTVLAEGNVIPWLLASRCLIHNGCTTAVESALLGTDIVSYVPVDDDRYEFHLPNKLGIRASSDAEVIAAIKQCYDPLRERACDAKAAALLGEYVHPFDDTLAAQKIVEIIAEVKHRHRPTVWNRSVGRVRSEYRSLSKSLQRSFGVARYSRGFTEQRFPAISAATLQAKIDRLGSLIKAPTAVTVSTREADLFEIAPCA